MGRELKRVALDFEWPLDQVWKGYLNPHYTAEECRSCGGSGSSPHAKQIKDLWYGYAPFRPEDNGSVPFEPDHPIIRRRAERNIEMSPGYYGTDEAAIQQEARRLANLFNKSMSHHLNDEDVAALVERGRLMDLTHTWSKGAGWQPKEPPYVPSAREVNEWSLDGLGHDSCNQGAVAKARCERLGLPHLCSACGGEGHIWPSEDAKAVYEAWEQYEPPAGDGYQVWETVSEGSPISPVFATPEALAAHMATTRWGADKGTSYETWLAFVRGPGWAPSMIGSAAGLETGVEGVVALTASEDGSDDEGC